MVVNMKTKIIFSMYDLNIGGIETSLLNILKNFDYEKYDVSLFVEKKEGIFLNEVPRCVKIINYNICDSKNIIFRKIKNRLKYIYYSIKYFKKFDCGICYASHRRVGSKIIPKISKKNILWVHGNYWDDQDSFNKFLVDFNIKKYKNIIFVSNALKEKFLKYVKLNNTNIYAFNNLIDYKNMIKLSNEEKIKKEKITFLNVGRHTEEEKNLSMLFNVMKKIKDDGYDFNLFMVGDGIDHNKYKEMVKDLKLTENIIFFGKRKNPFVFYKVADAFLLTSIKEGNPVVFLESKVFNVPIITTDVSDALVDIDNRYGLVSKNSFEDYYNTLKKFLDEGFIIKEKFDVEKYNKDILNEIYNIIDGDK